MIRLQLPPSASLLLLLLLQVPPTLVSGHNSCHVLIIDPIQVRVLVLVLFEANVNEKVGYIEPASSVVPFTEFRQSQSGNFA